MKNEKYWRDRQIEREQHWYDLATQALNEEIKLYYQQSLEKIQRDIASLYARFGVENKLSPAEARRLIRGEEFRVWRKTLEEYVKDAKRDSAILKELNTLAMRSRISRLEALHARTLMEIADLCEKLNQFEDAFQYRAYLANFYGNLYDIHRTVGLTTPPVAVDKNQAEKVIRTAWSGANYSSRIWKNGVRLERELKETVLTAVHRGTSIQKLSQNLSRRMEVGYNNAERLVRTELNYVQNRAALDSIQSAGLEYYQFIAALDRRTCPRCGSLDGRVIALEEAMQGDNYPPLHPRCRCTVTAALGEDLPVKRGKRISERREKLDGGVTYSEWKSRYLESAVSAVEGKIESPSAVRVIATSKDVPVLKCKTFSELKTYWADNYNVKVSDSIKKLHFESVREAMGGVEKAILEFPPAGALLSEFAVRRKYNAPMFTQYGGRYVSKPDKINFNPDYFDKAEHLKVMIMGNTTDYHPKNTGIFETGSHEMGHIIEDWLAFKYAGTFDDLSNRIFARKIIQEAFSRAKSTQEGKGKNIIQMKQEISQYADKTLSECLSEAISDYIANGENASILSKEIWECLKEELD